MDRRCWRDPVDDRAGDDGLVGHGPAEPRGSRHESRQRSVRRRVGCPVGAGRGRPVIVIARLHHLRHSHRRVDRSQGGPLEVDEAVGTRRTGRRIAGRAGRRDPGGRPRVGGGGHAPVLGRLEVVDRGVRVVIDHLADVHRRGAELERRLPSASSRMREVGLAVDVVGGDVEGTGAREHVGAGDRDDPVERLLVAEPGADSDREDVRALGLEGIGVGHRAVLGRVLARGLRLVGEGRGGHERHLQLVLVLSLDRVARIEGHAVVANDHVRVAVGDEDRQVRSIRRGSRQEVAAHPEAVLPVRAAVRVEAIDVRVEGRCERRVRHGRVVPGRRTGERQPGDGRELRHREARTGVVERAGEGPERRPDGTGRAGVTDRPGLVEDHQDVDAARRVQVRIGDRGVVLAWRRRGVRGRETGEQAREHRGRGERDTGAGANRRPRISVVHVPPTPQSPGGRPRLPGVGQG